MIMVSFRLSLHLYTNLTFVCDVRDVRDVEREVTGGHGKPFDPS